jgi:hypothetical protein
MSLANDKGSIPAVIQGPNAEVAGDLASTGFQNVLQKVVCNFQSGNSLTKRVFIGETAPSTNYDSIAKNGDEYWLVTFSGGVPTSIVKYLYAGSAWVAQHDTNGLIGTAQIAADAVTGAKIADDAVSLEHLDTGITPSHIIVAYSAKTTDGGNTTENGPLTNALSTDTLIISAQGLGVLLTKAWTADAAWICTLSADPGTTGVLQVMAIRAAA